MRQEKNDYGELEAPYSTLVRDHAERLLVLTTNVFEFARWIDRGKDFAETYWRRYDELCAELAQEVKDMGR